MPSAFSIFGGGGNLFGDIGIATTVQHGGHIFGSVIRIGRRFGTAGISLRNIVLSNSFDSSCRIRLGVAVSFFGHHDFRGVVIAVVTGNCLIVIVTGRLIIIESIGRLAVTINIERSVGGDL